MRLSSFLTGILFTFAAAAHASDDLIPQAKMIDFCKAQHRFLLEEGACSDALSCRATDVTCDQVKLMRACEKADDKAKIAEARCVTQAASGNVKLDAKTAADFSQYCFHASTDVRDAGHCFNRLNGLKENAASKLCVGAVDEGFSYKASKNLISDNSWQCLADVGSIDDKLLAGKDLAACGKESDPARVAGCVHHVAADPDAPARKAGTPPAGSAVENLLAKGRCGVPDGNYVICDGRVYHLDSGDVIQGADEVLANIKHQLEKQYPDTALPDHGAKPGANAAE